MRQKLASFLAREPLRQPARVVLPPPQQVAAAHALVKRARALSRKEQDACNRATD